ncbi:MerR family transcriptional regulator [Streptomyces sp. NPDC056367]|uniref:helix-turn-helix domain-containing protein n=1 Tax=Streptomyces sp. NPDC056367 TaxID=3345797 RepID=UPI0035DA92A0
MDSETLYSIGELSRRTGLTVKTIRFYSDQGIVPPTDRSPAGYRLYGPDARARLDLARTLRDLGIDLATVRRVLDRELSLSEVTQAHADALDVQIRTLRLRRALLRALAGRSRPTSLEIDLVHRLATLSRTERRRLVADFIDEAFRDFETNPEFVALMWSALPELPEDPTSGQVDAWVELAGLCETADFRAAIRRTAEDQAEELSRKDAVVLQEAFGRAMRQLIDEACTAGLMLMPAADPEASPADALAELYARAYEDAGATSDLRRWLLARLRTGDDPLVERYWRLLATVNGWPPSSTLAPVHSWFTGAAA